MQKLEAGSIEVVKWKNCQKSVTALYLSCRTEPRGRSRSPVDGGGERERGRSKGTRSDGMEQGSWMDGRDEEKKRVVVVV
jgi:hypothetical protein